MTAQQLKNSILQMAVQGKLVPQNPDDEPASVLLERIKAEKEELIKQGKIKKDKKSSEIFRGASRNLPYAYCEQIGKEIRDISDEIPFDIPDSWEWVRLGMIGETNIGLTYRPADKTISGGTLVLRSSNIQNDRMDYTDNVYVSCDIPERAMIHKGDILICARNGSRALVGKCAIVDKDGMAFGAFMAKYSSPFNQYIKLFIDSPIFRQQLDGVKTETINQITQDMLKNQLCPLPPVNEQIRIVEMFYKLLPYIEKYGTAETKLTELNTKFPDALKKSILQEAVQGKLVPQNPDDEPASVLLERIRAEKQALIKAGKIKKDKHESVIVTRDKIPYESVDGKERCIADEVPFDIPDNWCWCRLGTIFQHNTGKALNSLNHQGTKMQYITTSNLYWNRFELDKLKEMLFMESEVEKCTVNKGDLLVCEGGDIGRAAIWNYNYPMRIQNHIHRLRPYVPIEIYFFYYVFYFYKRAGLIGGKGIGIQGLSSNAIDRLLIPLPALAEQKRIVAKIEELMQHCDKL